jgi:hypothetical protein
MEPIGIGILSSSGYMPDLKVYWCPTGKDMDFHATTGVAVPSANARYSVVSYTHKAEDGANTSNWISLTVNCTGNAPRLLRSGGAEGVSDDKLLQFGDYGAPRTNASGAGFSAGSWCHAFSDNGAWVGAQDSVDYGGAAMALASSYAYRCQPVASVAGSLATWTFAGATLYGVNLTPYPRSVPDGYTPMFKTPKQLGNRALMSDRYGKPGSAPRTWPGDGILGHRDGYNVLYGDYHCAWYGDPQQQIIWNPPVNRSMGSGWYYGAYSGSDYMCGPKYNITGNPSYGCEFMHRFDVAAGIDVGVNGLYENLPKD